MMYMVFAFFIISACSFIPEKYINLSKKVQLKSFKKFANSSKKDIFLPGKYKYDKVSFNITKTLISTDYYNIQSFIYDTKLQAIALVLKNNLSKQIIDNEYYIYDIESSKIYLLEKLIGIDGNVVIFKAILTDIFSALSNFTVLLDMNAESSDDPRLINAYTSIGFPEEYTYEELKKSHLDYIPYTTSILNSNNENISLNVKIGGYASISASCEIKFESFNEFSAKINILGEGKFETGFQDPIGIMKINNLKIASSDLYKNNLNEKPLNNFNYNLNISPFFLSINFGLFFDIIIDDIDLIFDNYIEVTTSSFFTFNKEFIYRTSKEEKVKSQERSYNFDLDYNVSKDAINNYADTKMSFTPNVEVSLYTDIILSFEGEDPKTTRIYTGCKNKYEVIIESISDELFCTYPFLTYSYISYEYHIFTISKQVMFNLLTLINEKNNNNVPFWVSENNGPKCFYRYINPSPLPPYNKPLFYANKINNTNLDKFNVEIIHNNNTIATFETNEDKKLDFIQKFDSNNDNITFSGNWYDPHFLDLLMLTFYPKTFQSDYFLAYNPASLTNYKNFDSKFYFNFYQGAELKLFIKDYPTKYTKYAFFESLYDVSIIQQIEKSKYVIRKTRIYDDQFMVQDDKYFYHRNSYWKLKIDCSTKKSMKITIMLINSKNNITEKSIIYKENSVINMNNHKFGLHIVLKNGDSKFILVDFDINQHNQIKITKELFFNTNIEITLIPYSPLIFFDLVQTSFTNGIGLIPSPILDSKKIYSFTDNNEIITILDPLVASWKYLIYYFKTDLTKDAINEKIYIILSSHGYYPLNAKEEFYNEIYLLEFTEFMYEDDLIVFYIPFIRNRNYKNGDEIVIKAIFAQPLQNDAFCPNSFRHSSFNSKIAIGCIETNLDFESFLHITSIDENGNQYNPKKLFFEQNTFVYINLFDIKINNNMLIARIPSFFPDDSLTLNIDKYLIDALLSYSFNSITIKCDRCSEIYRSGETYQSNENGEIKLTLKPSIYYDYYAVCSSTEGTYCIQKLQLDPSKVTLIKKPMNGIFTELNYLENIESIIIPNAQLFSSYGKSKLIYSKNIKYGLQIENELSPLINLKLKAETKGKYVRLYSITENNIYFPFSVSSIISSFKDSLNQLGLNSQKLDLYKVRDEIFINNENNDAFISLPHNPSPDLLYGLSSSVISSITIEYQLESLQPQSSDYMCYCLVDTLDNQDCLLNYYSDCQNYLKLTPHEYNNIDVYWPENANWRSLIMNLATDINDFHPSFENYPIDIWKFFFTCSSNKKLSGSIIVPLGQRVDQFNSIDSSGLDITIQFNLKKKMYSSYDASSSHSYLNINMNIEEELQNKVDKPKNFLPKGDVISNSHYLESWKLNKKSKRISTKGEYTYNVISTYSGVQGDETFGHYQFLAIYEENGIHINEHFCTVDDSGENSLDICIPIKTTSLVTISQIIKSYPGIDNHITIHFIKNNRNMHSDFLSQLSSDHQNVFITICSDDYELTDNLIIYPNLNISFEGNLNMEQLILKHQVKIGLQQNVSLNNKKVQKIEFSILCPDIEMGFNSKQTLIYGFNTDNIYSFEEKTCELEHSTLTFSMSIDYVKSDLYLDINQNFNSYPNSICLFSSSPNKCNVDDGIPINIDNFNSDYINSNQQVKITIVDDYKASLNLQSKSVTFIGYNVKFSGNLNLSSDSNINILNIDISELTIDFSFDISNNKISSIDLSQCKTLPKAIRCILLNPNSNIFKKQFAQINSIENISLKFVSNEIIYSNIIISAELYIDGSTIFVNLKHFNAKNKLCYYNTDSSICQSYQPVNHANMWKDINETIIYIAANIYISNVELTDSIVYFTGSGKLEGKMTLKGSTICHFLQKKLNDELIIDAVVDFDQKKSPQIIFGDLDSSIKEWNLFINGCNYISSFIILKNKYLLPNKVNSNDNSNVVIEKMGTGTAVHFIHVYKPNHFCIYDNPYESICLMEYSHYKPIYYNDLWYLDLNSNDEIQFIFASSSTTFLPLKQYKDKNVNSASIKILQFSELPTFIIPEDFTIRVSGETSNLVAKISINTTSLKYGKILFNDINKIQLVPIDKIVIYENDNLLIMNENNYQRIYYEIYANSLYNMKEISVKSEFIEYSFDSDSIDKLYNDESSELKSLKLSKNTIIDLSRLKVKKLAIFGSQKNLSLVSTNSISFLSSLFINSSIIEFDSVFDIEIGVFNSIINIYPFSSKEQTSPDVSLKYNNKIIIYDDSTIELESQKIKINDEEYMIENDKEPFNLYIDDFVCIKNLNGKEISLNGMKSYITIGKSESSIISFNEFELIYIDTDIDISDISFNNVSLINIKSPIKTNINKYNQNSKDGKLIVKSSSIKIDQIDLYGKSLYLEYAAVSILNVNDQKSLIKNVIIGESLIINHGASLISYSSTFSPTILSEFHISSVSPLLILVDSKFDCIKMTINFDRFIIQTEEFVLIKGLETIEYCNTIINKVDKSNDYLNYDLNCIINASDKTIELIVSNCSITSKEFTISNVFTISNAFEPSNNFSNSLFFTESHKFLSTNHFSKSKDFSETNEFTSSHEFSSTNEFSESNIFSKSNNFSPSSEFLKTDLFSNSNKFTFSQPFTQSLAPTHFFSQSNVFTLSELFSESNQFTPTPTQSLIGHYVFISNSLTEIMISVKTVIFSYLYEDSISKISCTNENGILTLCETHIYICRYSPYIIYSMSPSYLVVEIAIEMVKTNVKITREQLIGFTCGSAAVLLSIIGIIFLILKKKNTPNNYSDVDLISSDNDDEGSSIFTENSINYQIDGNDLINADNWL